MAFQDLVPTNFHALSRLDLNNSTIFLAFTFLAFRVVYKIGERAI
jgi:hypothetical protein